MKILGTGLSGLVGSRVVELLGTDYVFENLSLETGVDITDKDSVDSFFQNQTHHGYFISLRIRTFRVLRKNGTRGQRVLPGKLTWLQQSI